MGWIEACLRWTGQFGAREKQAYCAVFDVTEGMVSRDQKAFSRLYNEAMGAEIVKVEKGRLLPTAAGCMASSPLFPEPDILRWMEGVLWPSGFVDVPPIHRAPPQPEVLQPVVGGILGKRPLRFRYRPRRGGEALRTVSPHVVVHAANRLHLRGWDHDRGAARDFLLTRMWEVRLTGNEVPFVPQRNDRDRWEKIELEIAVRPGEDLDAVRLDFALDETGTKRLRVPRAHLPYLLDGESPEGQGSIQSPVTVRTAIPTSDIGRSS